jgi:hypothetical protein
MRRERERGRERWRKKRDRCGQESESQSRVRNASQSQKWAATTRPTRVQGISGQMPILNWLKIGRAWHSVPYIHPPFSPVYNLAADTRDWMACGLPFTVHPIYCCKVRARGVHLTPLSQDPRIPGLPHYPCVCRSADVAIARMAVNLLVLHPPPPRKHSATAAEEPSFSPDTRACGRRL